MAMAHRSSAFSFVIRGKIKSAGPSAWCFMHMRTQAHANQGKLGSGRNRLFPPRTYTHASINLWNGAAGKHGSDWFLLSLRCHQLSASCPGRGSRGLWLRFVVWVAKNTRCPCRPQLPCTQKHTSHCLLQQLTGAQGFSMGFYPLRSISRPKCWLHNEWKERDGGILG